MIRTTWAVATFSKRLNQATTDAELKQIRSQLNTALDNHPRENSIREEIARNTAKGRQP